MGEHDFRARRQQPHPAGEPQDGGEDYAADEGPASRSEREKSAVIQRERSLLAGVSRVLRFADFMAILMVLATVFSAYATWRTAQVTRLVFAISDRPFLGIEKVAFEAVDSATPTIAVEMRNFGKIPAQGAIVTVRAIVDGKVVAPVNGELSTLDMGIMSPTVPHFMYAYLTPGLYRAVTSGASNLQVRVRMLYKGPALDADYCYDERMAFDYRTASFRAVGGGDRCGSEVF